jgi:hypothetical protein
MNDVGFPQLNWFKSSKSSPDGQCTMCARLPDGGMAVKDSKHPHGPVLLFPASQWRAFTEGVKLSDFR